MIGLFRIRMRAISSNAVACRYCGIAYSMLFSWSEGVEKWRNEKGKGKTPYEILCDLLSQLTREQRCDFVHMAYRRDVLK